MAELADAHDSKSCGKPCGFESHFGHQRSDTSKCIAFFINRDEWNSKRSLPNLEPIAIGLDAG